MNTADPAFDGLQQWPDALAQDYIAEGIWGTENLTRWLASKLAKKAKLSSKKIAEALAGKTHPELYKIDLLLQALGYRLTIQPQT